MAQIDDRSYIPTIQVRADCAILYNLPDFKRSTKKTEFIKPAYGGTVTKGVQKRISSAIDVFLQTTDTRDVFNTVTGRSMKFRCGFLTTTISDFCDWKAEKCYTNLLRPYLRILREKHSVQKYMWKYELQRRGNVHYHILIDQFIAHDKVRGYWNKLQHKHRLTDDYASRYGHFNPNSTDIHKVWKIQNLGAYLGKYLQKGNSQALTFHDGFPALFYDRDVKGKVWDCSADLKRSRYTAVFDWENNDRLVDLMDRKEATVLHLDNCTVVRCPCPEKLLTDDQNIDYCIWRYGT